MEDPEVEFEEVEVQEWVCKRDPSATVGLVGTNGEASQNAMDIDPTPVTTEAVDQKRYNLVKIVHTKLFCPIHNAVSISEEGVPCPSLTLPSHRLYKQPENTHRGRCCEMKFFVFQSGIQSSCALVRVISNRISYSYPKKTRQQELLGTTVRQK